MTSKEFRAAVFAEIQQWAADEFPSLPVIYENGPVPDQDKIGPIWLDVDIRWYGGSIASVGTAPRKRMTGAVAAMCYFREAGGTSQPDDVVDSLGERLSARRLGGAVILAPQRTVPTHLMGWYKSGVLLPFTLG